MAIMLCANLSTSCCLTRLVYMSVCATIDGLTLNVKCAIKFMCSFSFLAMVAKYCNVFVFMISKSLSIITTLFFISSISLSVFLCICVVFKLVSLFFMNLSSVSIFICVW